MSEQKQHAIEKILSYNFSDPDLLSKSLNHSSSVDEKLMSNERLEFLGDAVLDLVVCKYLFEKFPNYLEGDLTKVKSAIVSRKTCSEISNSLGLIGYLSLGKGMAGNRALNGSIAAGLLEALIAAIYVDGGYKAAQDFILRTFGEIIDKANANETNGNFKSLLQQYVQQKFNTTPVYELLDEKGPDHNKCFEIEVSIREKHFSSAWGINKKEAEQKAAYNALQALGILETSL